MQLRIFTIILFSQFVAVLQLPEEERNPHPLEKNDVLVVNSAD